MNKSDVKKLILLNLPYVFAFYFADKIAAVFRLAPGAAFIDKLTNGFAVFGSAFANPLPSFHPVDLLMNHPYPNKATHGQCVADFGLDSYNFEITNYAERIRR